MPAYGGEGWIRTIEVCDNRFTVCPLWPLGNLSIQYVIIKLIFAFVNMPEASALSNLLAYMDELYSTPYDKFYVF